MSSHSSRLPEGFYGEELYPIVNGVDPVRPPKHPLAPTGAPWMSGNWKEGDYRDPDHGCPNCAVPPVRSVEYRRWYYAATSYADHMLGQSLAKLRSLGGEVTAKTITVFHADHGYQL
jgi:arylsulfatase A-like enzyme